jgi:hypothetical protein
MDYAMRLRLKIFCADPVDCVLVIRSKVPRMGFARHTVVLETEDQPAPAGISQSTNVSSDFRPLDVLGERHKILVFDIGRLNPTLDQIGEQILI